MINIQNIFIHGLINWGVKVTNRNIWLTNAIVGKLERTFNGKKLHNNRRSIGYGVLVN